jgi:hypothetical protein
VGAALDGSHRASQVSSGPDPQTESAVRGYVITGDDTPVSDAVVGVDRADDHAIADLVSDNPLQEVHASRITAGGSTNERLSQLVRLTTAPTRSAESEIKGGQTRPDAASRRRTGKLVPRGERPTERRDILEAAWQRLSWLLVSGTAAATLLASILILLFTGGPARACGASRQRDQPGGGQGTGPLLRARRDADPTGSFMTWPRRSRKSPDAGLIEARPTRSSSRI